MPQDPQKVFPVGAILSPDDKKDIYLENVTVAVDALPRIYSLRDQMTAVPLQWFGSCVGFTGKALKEYQEKKEHGSDIILSGRFVYAMCKINDGQPQMEGTFPRILMKVLAGVGACLETTHPSDQGTASHADYVAAPPLKAVEEAISYRINGFARISTLQGLKEAIYKYGAVQITVQVFDTFDYPVNGFIKQHTTSGGRGLHSVTAIGWNDDLGAIEFKNSWGTTWGDKGFAFLSYSYEAMGLPFQESWVGVDFIDAKLTSGAPIALVYPVDNYFVTQQFGARPEYYLKYGMKGHNGIDLRCPTGGKVYATDDGTVIFSGVKGGYGNCIMIQHTWGVSIYGHLKDFVVSDMQGNAGMPPTVKAGQLIAHGDSTGDSDAPHLHFAIRINGVSNPGFFDWVDPTPYFVGHYLPNIPAKGFALIDTIPTKTAMLYVKIPNPDQFQALADILKIKKPSFDELIAANAYASNIMTLPAEGFMFSNDRRTVIYYYKISDEAKLAALSGLFGVTADYATMPPASAL